MREKCVRNGREKNVDVIVQDVVHQRAGYHRVARARDHAAKGLVARLGLLERGGEPEVGPNLI